MVLKGRKWLMIMVLIKLIDLKESKLSQLYFQKIVC